MRRRKIRGIRKKISPGIESGGKKRKKREFFRILMEKMKKMKKILKNLG